MNDVDASAVLYAGLTAWSGLFVSGQLGGLTGATTSLGGGSGKRVCILGASGGVGHLAVQLARAENCFVVATCATDAVPIVCGLGADHVIDYSADDGAHQQLADAGPYDIVLDCAGKGAEYATQVPWKYGHYVTYSSPLLKNMDQFGLVGGAVKSVGALLESNFKSYSAGGLVKWAYFVPSPHAIEYLHKMVNQKKVINVSIFYSFHS